MIVCHSPSYSKQCAFSTASRNREMPLPCMRAPGYKHTACTEQLAAYLGIPLCVGACTAEWHQRYRLTLLPDEIRHSDQECLRVFVVL